MNKDEILVKLREIKNRLLEKHAYGKCGGFCIFCEVPKDVKDERE